MLLSRTLIALACLILLATSTWAQGEVDPDVNDPPGEQGEAGTGFVTLQLGYFDLEDDGDGNPYLDEDLTIVEPVIIFDYNVTDRLGIGAKFSYDYVSSASIDRLSDFPDQSGASGDNYYGGDLSIRYKTTDRTTVGGHVSYSTEYDYDSFGFGVNVAHEPRKNTLFSASFDAFFDEVDIIRFDGTDDEGTDDRTTYSGTVKWYQILTPKMEGEIGLTVAHQTGFLETPYNAVVILDPALPPNGNLENMARGFEVTEELPNDRTRGALFGRLRRWMGDGMAVELWSRLYADTWDIYSITLEPRYYQNLIDDCLDMRLRYRYYNQTEAEDYEDEFFVEERHRTQDSDLSDFDSHMAGVKFSWYASERSTLDMAFDYVMRSDDLDYYFGSLGWTWSF